MRIRFFDEEKQKLTLVINGEEITNPVARFLIGGAALVFAIVVVLLVVLIILPLLGVTVAGSLIVAALAVLVIIPLLPFFLLGKWLHGRSQKPDEIQVEILE